MPRTLSSFSLQEKNKLTSSTIWLIALEITIPGVAVPVRVISNNESVTWRGESWIAFPFHLGMIGEESKGEVPRVELRISNVSRSIESYLQSYSTYCKANGYSPIELTIYVINNQGSSSGVLTDTTADGAVTDTGQLGALTDALYDIVNPDPEASFEYELQSIRTDSMWATFMLGAANPFQKRFPMHRMIKNHCRFRFKDTLCGYVGPETVCDKTLPRCREIWNYHTAWVSGVTNGNPTIVYFSPSLSIADFLHLANISGVRDGDGNSPLNGKNFSIGPINTSAASIPVDTTGCTPYEEMGEDGRRGQASVQNRFGGFPHIGLKGLRLA